MRCCWVQGTIHAQAALPNELLPVLTNHVEQRVARTPAAVLVK